MFTTRFDRAYIHYSRTYSGQSHRFSRRDSLPSTQQVTTTPIFVRQNVNGIKSTVDGLYPAGNWATKRSKVGRRAFRFKKHLVRVTFNNRTESGLRFD